jgi:hypothetical protein
MLAGVTTAPLSENSRIHGHFWRELEENRDFPAVFAVYGLHFRGKCV